MSTITLVFTPDNPCNTTLTDADTGKVVYTVATHHTPEKTVTEIRNAGGGLLASSEWRDVRSDIITLGNAPPVPSSAWLRKSIVPFKDTVTFTSASGANFKWKGNGPGLSFELYSADDKSQPIARFLRSRRFMNHNTTPPTRDVTPASLVLDERGAAIQDLVVISFCLLEKSRRAREASTQNRADVLGTPMVSVGKSSNYKLSNGGV